MGKTLALIHTSMVFILRETMMNDLFKEIMPEVRLINIVDDSLLSDVMNEGKISPLIQERMNQYIIAAEKTGANAILSLCSSLGPTIDNARKLVKIPVIKIDDAMALRATQTAKQIGVMATIKTTLTPTCDLIQEKADYIKKKIKITPCLVKGAFELLMKGDRSTHDTMVTDIAKELAQDVDIIVFAQASMTRLADPISKVIGKPILTSPRLAIEYTKKVLDGLEYAK